MNQIRALVWKDLLVHGRAAGLLLVGWPVGVRLLALIPQASQDADSRTVPVAVTMLSLLLYVAVALGLASMLVERERSKETFAWLRTLPVSDAHIVAGKCATGLVLHAAGSVAWWVVLGRVAPSLTVPQAISVWCAAAVFGSLALVSQIASPRRPAQATPVAVLALGLLAGAALRQRPGAATPVLEAWRGSWEHLMFWTGCVAVYALLVAVAYWGFHTRDTHVLVD